MGNERRGIAPDSPVEGMLAVPGQAGGAGVRHAREVHPRDRGRRTVADRDQAAARVDAVAGSEFLDDRIDFG